MIGSILSDMPLKCRFLVAAVLWLTACTGCSAAATREKVPSDADPPLHYWSEERKTPRPLRIHVLRVDLRSPRYEVVALIPDDPDGDGPADAWLENPISLAESHQVVAAVNANAFASLPDPKGGRSTNWFEGKPVEVLGWAVTGGRQQSAPQKENMSFWMDPDGRPHIQQLKNPEKAREAVAGFGPLLIGGQRQAQPNKLIHPRTAIGTDKEERHLFLVVVDGRRPQISEGLSLEELAALMKELGCEDAINLDGGGSSILLMADARGQLKAMNMPSDNRNRPVPVMLGIRERKPTKSPSQRSSRRFLPLDGGGDVGVFFSPLPRPPHAGGGKLVGNPEIVSKEQE